MSRPSGSNEENSHSDGGQQGETTILTGEQQPPSRDSSRSSHQNFPPRSRQEVRERLEQIVIKLKGVCTRRGFVLICAVLTNILVLVCVISARISTSDTSLKLEESQWNLVKDLDMEFSQMKAPGVYGGAAFSLTFGVTSLLFVVVWTKPPQLMSQNFIWAAFVFQEVGAVFYVVAVGVYLYFVTSVNSSNVCKQRERIYSRNGYPWINCNMSAPDTAAAVFGLITAILYIVGAVFTFWTIRRVTSFMKDRKKREAETQRGRHYS